MKGFLLCTLFMLVIVFSCPVSAKADEKPVGGYIEGEVIVMLEALPSSDYPTKEAYEKALKDQAEAFANEYGLQLIGGPAPFPSGTIIGLRSEHKSTEELIKELSSVPGVISVEPNFIVGIPEPIKSGGCNAAGYSSALLLLAGLALFAQRIK